jgi:hypothetical protein
MVLFEGWSKDRAESRAAFSFNGGASYGYFKSTRGMFIELVEEYRICGLSYSGG